MFSYVFICFHMFSYVFRMFSDDSGYVMFSFCGYVWISHIGRYQKQAQEMIGDSLDSGIYIFNRSVKRRL